MMSDLPHAVGQVVVDEGWEPPPPKTGPYMSPIDRYHMLPEKTRHFFEKLREEDIDRLDELRRFSSEDIIQIREAMKFAASAKTLSRFGRAVLLTIFGTFTATVLAGEKFMVVWKWIFGSKS